MLSIISTNRLLKMLRRIVNEQYGGQFINFVNASSTSDSKHKLFRNIIKQYTQSNDYHLLLNDNLHCLSSVELLILNFFVDKKNIHKIISDKYYNLNKLFFNFANINDLIADHYPLYYAIRSNAIKLIKYFISINAKFINGDFKYSNYIDENNTDEVTIFIYQTEYEEYCKLLRSEYPFLTQEEVQNMADGH